MKMHIREESVKESWRKRDKNKQKKSSRSRQ